MAVNDLTAVGVMKGLVSAGLRIPQDISVTGFDKTRLAEYSNPSITTVDIHRDLLGQMAPMPCMHFVAPPILKAGIRGFRELVVGDSSGPWNS